MKLLRQAFAAAALFICASAGPAAAAGQYVYDGPGLLQKGTVDSLNSKIDALHDKTGKAVIVDIVDSLGGKSVRDYASADFQKYSVNGVMIFISKNPKSVAVIGDKNSSTIFPAGSLSNVRMTIRSSFRQAQYDEGVTNGVNSIIDTYQSHAGTLQQRRRSTSVREVPGSASAYTESRGGGTNWWLIIGIGLVIFFIIRAISRANTANYYNNQNPGGMGYGGGPGYGGPGYGGGGGFGGGGGGFFSGLLGGLGGAFLGNQLFGNHGNDQNTFGQNVNDQGQQADNYDASAFQNDAGQADMGNASFGDWGDSGGGGSDFGGGGDSGGGGDNSSW